MKRISIGNGIYVDESGSHWGRPSFNGRRTWRRLGSQTPKKAACEFQSILAEASERTQFEKLLNKYAKSAPDFSTLPEKLLPHAHRLQRFDLPQLGSGIYFLMRGGQCVYVGQSKTNIFERVVTHLKDKKFDHFYFLPIDDNFDEAERHFVQELKPLLNGIRFKNHVRGGTFLD